VLLHGVERRGGTQLVGQVDQAERETDHDQRATAAARGKGSGSHNLRRTDQ
jgi:hypothetical protein